MAKLSDTDLPKGVRHIKFSQDDFMTQYSGSLVYLNEEGVCAGICTEYYRFYKKREIASIYRGEDISQISFLYKLALRPYVSSHFDFEFPKTSKVIKDPDSFARRVQFYQIFSQDQEVIKEGPVLDLSFEGLFEHSRYLSVFLRGPLGVHVISLIRLCEKDHKFLEYRLFDPNFGEYQNIKTLDDLDFVWKFVLSEYNPPFTYYQVSDTDKLFIGRNLSENKGVFRFLDKMKEPMKLDAHTLKEILDELPKKVKGYIGTLIPNGPDVMMHILQLAPDELLSSCAAVYSVLEFAERNNSEEVANFILEEDRYLAVRDYNETALHWAVQKGSLKIAQALIKHMKIEDISSQDVDGLTALHIVAQNGDLKMVRALVSKMDMASILLKDAEGKTALDIASENGFHAVSEFLIKKIDYLSKKKQSRPEKRNASSHEDDLGKRLKRGDSPLKF